jgi:hypothetical protein
MPISKRCSDVHAKLLDTKLTVEISPRGILFRSNSKIHVCEACFCDDDVISNAIFPDELGCSQKLCIKHAKELGTYFIRSPCRDCPANSQISAAYPDEFGNRKKLCEKHAKQIGSYKLLHPCSKCPLENKKAAGFPDKSGARNMLCAKHSKEEDTYIQLTKKYACKFEKCEKIFKTSTALQNHICSHTGKRQFSCDAENCGKSFVTKAQLCEHYRTHTNEKPYRCDFEECKKSFRTQTQIINHKSTHTKQKIYSCKFAKCTKSFGTARGLKRHGQLHAGNRRFSCDHCSFRSVWQPSLIAHVKLHEKQKSYKFACCMQDGGTQLWNNGDVPCSIRAKTKQDMDIHIERNHTVEGLGKKLRSETKLAQFLDSNSISYDRDWGNLIKFSGCQNIEGGKSSARPDFFLPEFSLLWKAIVIIGNDEFAHRQNVCDLQRTFNITQAVQQTNEFKDMPILYIRFNPHSYQRDGVFYSHPLVFGHNILLEKLRNVCKLNDGLNLIYIHYDESNGNLDIFDNEKTNDFGVILRDCVLYHI